MAMSTNLFAGETNFVESRGNKPTNQRELSEGARYRPFLRIVERLLNHSRPQCAEELWVEIAFEQVRFIETRRLANTTNCSKLLKKQI